MEKDPTGEKVINRMAPDLVARIKNPLDEINGIGPGRKRALLLHFGRVDGGRTVHGDDAESLHAALAALTAFLLDPGISPIVVRRLAQHPETAPSPAALVPVRLGLGVVADRDQQVVAPLAQPGGTMQDAPG